MDLRYVQYDNEFECSLESKIKPIDVKLRGLFIANTTTLLYSGVLWSGCAVFVNRLVES